MQNEVIDIKLNELITHKTENIFEGIDEHLTRLKTQPNLALPVDEEINLLKQLTEFELGRFLLANKGLDGYWTRYVHGAHPESLHPLEKWLITRAPAIRATKERFQIFQSQLLQNLKSNFKIASIPCGWMDDLLTLDYSMFSNIELIGIDLDKKSLEAAAASAAKKNIQNVKFIERTAWDLKCDNEFNIITSNGLNIYVQTKQAELALYTEFYKALQKDGILITSFLTYPPLISDESPWQKYDPADLLKQKAIFSDIMNGNWQVFSSEHEMKSQLKLIGFKEIEVIYDTSAIFPTIVCRK